MKPGNSVEDKTLTTGTKELGPLAIAHQEREVVDEKRGGQRERVEIEDGKTKEPENQ
jgi:hypothetical protein